MSKNNNPNPESIGADVVSSSSLTGVTPAIEAEQTKLEKCLTERMKKEKHNR